MERLKELITNDSKTIEDFYDLLKRPEFNLFFNNPFQSFFRESDTQKLFECAENYFERVKPIQHRKVR
ncbi:MAG: hypothetical protein O7D30_11955 [Rickettsia endosymbiont of Ixodes persulcatus]|nr:hypothetical protein [Rickettsia endosymbiont of Ixodes persulcatus]